MYVLLYMGLYSTYCMTYNHIFTRAYSVHGTDFCSDGILSVKMWSVLLTFY